MGSGRDTSHLLIPVWVPGQDDPEFDPEWALPRDEHPDFEDELAKHYGPGAHPGTGSPQAVHGRGGHRGRISGPVSPTDDSPLPAPAAAKLADPATPFEGYEPWSVLDQTIEIDGEEMTIRQWWEAKEGVDKDIDSILYDLRRETGISADKSPPVPDHYRYIETDDSTGYYGQAPKLPDDLTSAEALAQMSDVNEHMKRLEQELYWHNTQGRRVPYGGTSPEAAAAYARRQQESMLRLERQMGKSHMLQLARKALPLVIEHGSELRSELIEALASVGGVTVNEDISRYYMPPQRLIDLVKGTEPVEVPTMTGSKIIERLPEWKEHIPLADKLEEALGKIHAHSEEYSELRTRWQEWSYPDDGDTGIAGIGGKHRLYIGVSRADLKEVKISQYGDTALVPKSGTFFDLDTEVVSVDHFDVTDAQVFDPSRGSPHIQASRQVRIEREQFQAAIEQGETQYSSDLVLLDAHDIREMHDQTRKKMSSAGKRLDTQIDKMRNELALKLSGKSDRRDMTVEAITSTIGKYRELGGTLDITNQRATKAVTMIRSMEQFIPADWVRYSNINAVDASRMDVKLRTNNRGHYLHSEGTLQLDGRVTTTFHEFGHRMEYVNPMLRSLELAFIEKRSEYEDLVPMHSVSSEYSHYKNYAREAETRPDMWANAYSGKDYGHANEVVSMGMGAYGGLLYENLMAIKNETPFGRVGAAGFGGKKGDANTNMIDAEHMDFILGLLRDA